MLLFRVWVLCGINKDEGNELTIDRAKYDSKIYKLVLFNNIFVQLFWSLFASFFLVFPSRKLSVTFDIQIDSKMKHS